MGHGQALPEDLHLISRAVDGGRSMGIVLDILRKGRLTSSGDHGGREAVGLMGHRVESQHDAWDLLHPCLGGSALKQTSSEHVIHGLMATLVDGIPLRMVRRSQDTLDSQRAHQLPQTSPTNSRRSRTGDGVGCQSMAPHAGGELRSPCLRCDCWQVQG